MKKIMKVFLVLLGLFPLILNAEETNKEWRWYKFVEEDVHYEKEVENICGSFDKEKFMYGDYVYSLEKPKEQSYREIEEVVEELDLSREYINIIDITRFSNISKSTKIYEIEILNKNNEKEEYIISSYSLSGEMNNLKDDNYETYSIAQSYSSIKLKLNNTLNIKEMTIKIIYEKNDELKGLTFSAYINQDIFANAFAPYSTDNTVECSDNICNLQVKIRAKEMYNEPITIKTKVYKYRDKYYKCFTNTKEYAPGYYSELDGYIKDIYEYREININKENKQINEIKPIYEEYIVEENEEAISKDTTVEIENDIEETNNKIAMTNEVTSKTKISNFKTFISFFVPLFLLGTTIYVIKKIKKCRAK